MLIQDIKPVKRVRHLYLGIPARRQEAVARELEESVLITELWQRGISIQHIFGSYYALEETANHRDDEIFGSDEEGQHGRSVLTVGDAELAGHVSLPAQPLARQPF